MLPLYLEMENIGPFVKTARIDLDSLEEDGLFLICGPTGAGKSFIFDAICYSLYGKTPSGRDRNMVSDHATEGGEPRIVFCFMVGERKYLVERVLQYEAPKRGGGTTIRPEKASLSIVLQDLSAKENTRNILATQKREVQNRIMEVLGLEMEQFSRVMMIPQGEFRELLRSDTEKREILLRKLFNSIKYRDISDSIEVRSKRLYGEIKDKRTTLYTVISTLVEKLDLGEGPGEGVTFGEWSLKTISELDQKMEELRKSEEERKERSRIYQERTQKARTIVRISDELQKAREQKVELERIEKTEISHLHRSLELNRKGQRMRSDLETMDLLLTDREKLEKETIHLKDQLSASKRELDIWIQRSEEQLPFKKKELEIIGTRRNTIGSFQPSVLEIEHLSRRISKLEGEFSILGKDQDKLLKEEGECKDGISKIKMELGLLPKKENVIELSQLEKAGKDLISIILEKQDLEIEMKDSISRCTNLEMNLNSRSKDLEDLRKRREISIAGELAKDLEEGMECPVCGSIKHPSPREKQIDDVTLETINSAILSVQEAREKFDMSRMEVNTIRTSIRDLVGRMESIGNTYPDLSDKDIKTMRKLVHDLGRRLSIQGSRDEKEIALQKERVNFEKKSQSIEGLKAPLKERIQELVLDIKGSKATLKEKISTIKGLDIEIDEKDPSGSLKREILNIEGRENELKIEINNISTKVETLRKGHISLEEKLSSREQSLKEISERLDEINEKLENNLKKAKHEGLETKDDLRRSLLSEDDENLIVVKVEDHKEKKIQVNNSIHTLEKSLIETGGDTSVPTMEELEKFSKEEEEAKKLLSEITEERARTESDLLWTKSQIEKVKRVSQEIEDLEKTMKVVGRLSKEVKGNSNPRVSLERFFLAQRFEEVLIASNQRLKILSGNRFLLRRADESETGGRSKGGLDLNVFDNYTGLERPANTLSGGQMFLSSLALALGLADVVQSRSGGIRMDALFIDEGFGSLDEETLQTALKVLMELRQGRMVGVISHVGELKRQIRTGYEIVPSPTGSVIRSIG